jgi:Ca-activated chloride channel family protein
MTVGLSQPLWLLLLVPIAALVAVAGRGTRALPARPGTAALALRGAGLALLALALAGPHVSFGHRRTTVLVIDRSASIDATMTSAELRWIRALPGPVCSDHCRIVSFASGARLLPAGGARLAPAPPAGGRGETDIAAGLDLGLGAVPNGGRLVLLSDGAATVGDVAQVEAAARARNVRVDVVPLADPRADAAITRFSVPAATHAGDQFALAVTVRSTVSRAATLALYRDGALLGVQRVSLRTGDNPYLVPQRLTAAGWHDYRATIAMSGDAVPANNSRDAAIRVAPPPRVLVAASSDADVRPLRAVLAAAGIQARFTSPRGLPASASGFAGTDASVLDDIPAKALGRAQVQALTAAVGRDGMGLFVLGGPHSLSLGGYAQSSLERLLPVRSTLPGSQQRNTVGLELVLDRSGSMADLEGGYEKIEETKAAALLTAQFVAAHSDQMGLVAFDLVPHVLIPMEQVTTGPVADTVVSQINTLSANGGTDIYHALSTGLQQLLRSNAPRRHLILMTDGISEPADYASLIGQIRRARLALTTIALEPGADTQLLSHLATATDGQYYPVTSAQQLPKIFTTAAASGIRPVQVHGQISVHSGAPSPVVNSLAGAPLPSLAGNVLTTLKTGASADLLARDPGSGLDPALAQWQYGVGRVLVWTPGLRPDWVGTWLSDEPRMWDDALRWLAKGVGTPPLEPVLSKSDPPQVVVDPLLNDGRSLDLAKVQATMLLPDGSVKAVSLSQVGPSRYQADLPEHAPGIYGITVRAPGSGMSPASALLALPYPNELVPRPADDSVLGSVAAASDGGVLGSSDTGALAAGLPTNIWWMLTIAAGALFLVEVGLRLSGWRGSSM